MIIIITFIDGNHLSNISVEKLMTQVQKVNHKIKCINLEKNCVNKSLLEKKGILLSKGKFKL